MGTEPAEAVIRGPEQVPVNPLGPGVTVAELLNDQHGCRGLHQRRLRFAGGGTVSGGATASGATASGATVSGVAGGRGECWYVIRGSGALDTEVSGTVELEPGTAVWIRRALHYRCRARPGPDLEIVAVTVQAGSEDADSDPALCVARLDECPPERTGDREFRVLLSSGLVITQFAGLIPPGRAPAHQHTYDEVVHVLAGRGVVHLSGAAAEIGPGTSIYLPPGQPHCLENTGPGPLEVLGVFYPAGSPAAKQASHA
jgi:mannose-6-phosphate isomerase-like protein (cupin superfamily)